MRPQSSNQTNQGEKPTERNRRLTGAETASKDSNNPESNAKQINVTETLSAIRFAKSMLIDKQTDESVLEGLESEFEITGKLAETLLKEAKLEVEKPQLGLGQEPKKNVLEIFKNRPESKSSYTAEGYEVLPDEGQGVVVEIEARHFGTNGKKISTPQIFKTTDKEWADWYSCRGGGAFSINKVFHRPSTVEPIAVDPWDEDETPELF